MWNKLTKVLKIWYSSCRKEEGMIVMKGKYDASMVAKWFLSENNYVQTISDTEFITNMKLQKLLYYAQGIYLAKYNQPLFKEKVLAWEHGPVIKEVYNDYKKYGANGIVYIGKVPEFSPEIEQFLEKIYECFGQYSAWKLRNMTHAEKPWLETKQNFEIKNDLMKEFFAENNYELL